MDENRIGTNTNLLRARVRFQKRKRGKYAQIQSIAMIVLAVYGGLVMLVFAVNAALHIEARKIEDSIASETRLIEAMQDKEYRQNLLVSRADLLGKVYAMKGNEREVMMALYDGLPDGVMANRFTTGEGRSSIELSGTSREVYSFRRYIDFVENSVENNIFSGITLSGLGRGIDAKYVFQAVFNIGESRSGGGDEEAI